MENIICQNDFGILDRPTHEIYSRRNATNGHRFAYNAPSPHPRALSYPWHNKYYIVNIALMASRALKMSMGLLVL
jgi:hypothetical protein